MEKISRWKCPNTKIAKYKNVNTLKWPVTEISFTQVENVVPNKYV